MAQSRPNPAPFIDVVNAKLPGQVARMRADTVRGSWKPRGKADKEAAADAGTAPKTTAKTAASGSATATAPTTERK